MLKNIDPLLTPELLALLARMGHGDDLAVVDANFPADSITHRGSALDLVRVAGPTVGRVVEAILSVFPIDDFESGSVRRMMVGSNPEEIPPIQREAMDALDRLEPGAGSVVAIDRFAFYERAAEATGLVAVGDARPYGCLLLRKGTIFTVA